MEMDQPRVEGLASPLPPLDLRHMEADLAIVRRVLQQIANGHRVDNPKKRLTRVKIELLAREACDVIGWPYDKASAAEAANEGA